jgi:hypothetical protein
MTQRPVGEDRDAILVEDRRFGLKTDWRFLGAWLLVGGLVVLTFLQVRFHLFGSGVRGLRIFLLIAAASTFVLIRAFWKKPARARRLPVCLISLPELPSLLATMTMAVGEPVYAGIWFNTTDQPREQDAVNLNFSLENSKVGFDWILLADRNVKDQDRFLEFARAKGFEPRTETKNGVSYFRVEEGDLAALARGIVSELYRFPPGQPMQMVCEGFVWPAI